MTKILIVHTPGLTRDLLAKAIRDEPTIQAVAVVAGLDAARAALAESEYKLVLVDHHLPDQQAVELLAMVNKEFPQVRVVVLGLPDAPRLIVEYLELGAAGCVRQSDTVQELIQIVVSALRGEAILAPAVTAALIVRLRELTHLAIAHNGYGDGQQLATIVPLSVRECEIVRWLRDGYQNQEIAAALGIAVKTVDRHVHNILEKLDVHRREQAVLMVRQLALTEAWAQTCLAAQPTQSLPVQAVAEPVVVA